MLQSCDSDGTNSLMLGIKRLFNTLIPGSVSASLSSWQPRSSVTALQKPNEENRSTASGEILWHLVTSFLMAKIATGIEKCFASHQLSVRSKAVCEIRYRSLQAAVTLHGTNASLGILQVDRTDAFNIISCKYFIKQTRCHFSILSEGAEFLLKTPSYRWNRKHQNKRSQRVQEGNSLGFPPCSAAINLISEYPWESNTGEE